MTFAEFIAQRAQADTALDRLFERMSSFQKRLASRVLELLSDLQKNSKGIIEATDANIRRIADIVGNIDGVFLDDEWLDAISDYLESYDHIERATISYGKTLGQVDDLLVRATKTAFKDVVANYLTDAHSFNRELQVPIAMEVHAAVLNGLSFTELTQNIRSRLLEFRGDGPLVDASKTIANEALSLYERMSLNAVAGEVGAKFYRYQGKPIDTTRPFCRERAGHAYSKAEIEQWGRDAAAGKGWEGMMPGTNEVTIFLYVGGYGPCQHVLVPIAKRDVPAEDMARILASIGNN